MQQGNITLSIVQHYAGEHYCKITLSTEASARLTCASGHDWHQHDTTGRDAIHQTNSGHVDHCSSQSREENHEHSSACYGRSTSAPMSDDEVKR